MHMRATNIASISQSNESKYIFNFLAKGLLFVGVVTLCYVVLIAECYNSHKHEPFD